MFNMVYMFTIYEEIGPDTMFDNNIITPINTP